MNILSSQWSTDGLTSSEPMELCTTSIVKTLTDNHTLDDRNHQGHHTTLLLSETVVHSPSKSVRRRSQELGINRKSVRIILIAVLQLQGSSGSSSGSSRMVPPPHTSNESLAWLQQRSLTDWSAAGVTHSGRHIHRTWTSQIFMWGSLDLIYWFQPQGPHDMANSHIKQSKTLA